MLELTTQLKPCFLMALVLACRAGADVQLSSPSHVVQPRPACRVSPACYDKVKWAMQTGLKKYPDWFSPLTSSSEFADFQRHLSGMSRFSDVCPEPCAARAVETPMPAQLPASDSCHTSVEGDDCYKRVVWVMETGVAKYPDRFSPLTNSSKFEDIQRHLHGIAKFSNVCPEPCAARAVETPVQARLPLSDSCHTSVEGDECYKRVVWVMETGVAKYPDRFSPLTNSSKFEDIQRHLHGIASFSSVCPEPCAARVVETPVQAQLPLSDSCHTSVEGDECYTAVVWAMQTGIAKYPDRFSPLTSSSEFEDFQRHLHGIAKFSNVCPEPCAARAVETPVPAQSPVGARLPSRSSATESAVKVRTDGSNETEGTWVVDGFNQTGRNCECGNIINAFPSGYNTSLLCASMCNLVPTCMSFGIHSDEHWPGHCDLFDAPCNDTDGHDAGTTCATPVPPLGISLNYNRFLTDAPTPSPTPVPDACEITDGSGPSASYPCSCGPVVCLTSEVCANVSSNATCSPPKYVHVEWPCDWPSILDPNFIFAGTSANGAPYYVNFHGNYIYFDESCDGSIREGSDRVPRWIIDESVPSESALRDLDSDGTCSYYGHHETEDYHGLPLGSASWVMYCGHTLVAKVVEITYLQEQPNITATPEPTLPPGLGCPCDDKCAGFPYADLDGDGCLTPAECPTIPDFAARFEEYDIDGDGCVTVNECVESPLAEFVPLFTIPQPNHCPYGYYFIPGVTSVCDQCTDGETRRRRSEACTKCPSGKDDFGDFDMCIGGVYLQKNLSAGDCVACVNNVTDENGVELTRGDAIGISTRNPDPGWYDLVMITGSTIVDNLSCFTIDPCVNNSYQPFDPFMPECTKKDGRSLSSEYPCACGIDACEQGETCDIEASAGSGVCIPPSTWEAPTPAPTVSARGDPHLVNLHGEHFDVNHGGEFTLLRIPQATSEPPMLELKASIRPEHGKPCTTYITEMELSGSMFGSKAVQVRSYLRSHAENETDKFLGLRVLDRTPGAAVEASWESLAQVTDSNVFVSAPQAEHGFMVTMSTTKWYSKKRADESVPNVAGQVELQIAPLEVALGAEAEDPKMLGAEPARILIRQDLPRQEHLNVALRRLGSLGRRDVGGLLGFDPHPESLEDVTPECQRHRDGLDVPRGSRSKPAWKTRWEKIRERRGQAPAPGDGMRDNEAAAGLVTADTEKMCVCPDGEPPARFEEEEEYVQSLAGGRGAEPGVVVEFQTGRLAEATWD